MAGTGESQEMGVVRRCLAALEDLDAPGVLELADEAIVYQNVPLPPARGRAAFGRQVRWLTNNMTGFEARLHAIAANGDTVLTERTDVLERGSFRAEFWVCGTFEVRDGKVVLWRDRFDFVDVTVAVVKGAVRALVAAIRSRSRAVA